ncbi:hypothetical protein DPMN_072528 [Dreissena polymorpha]|uniref:ATP-dependent DNA helicase n=1 Tax=Dreissena polymorpha TaxID=45954 RepID=A0A9D4BQJ3_DREPO|nr:hypothetical protein DPMN_072528 [Dreissena polymorpha]
MSTPDGSRGETLQSNLKNVKALLVDERSLIRCTTLGWTEFHCKLGIKNMTADWGGLPVVVFFGDDVQLPPVLDSPVYHFNGKIPAAMHGALVWQQFSEVVHLETIVRQNEE